MLTGSSGAGGIGACLAIVAKYRTTIAGNANKIASATCVIKAMWTVIYEGICLGKVWGCVSTRIWFKAKGSMSLMGVADCVYGILDWL